MSETEKLKFGIDHSEAGRQLGKMWTLPHNLVNVIANHHTPETATEDENLVTLVYLADLLMSKFQAHHELEQIDTEKLLGRLNRLNLNSDHLPILIDLIPKNIFQSAAIPI